MKRCLIILTVLLLISFQGVALASDIKPMIPIAEQLSAAKINDMEYDEENGFVCIEYSPADSADLDYLFTLCAACGTFSIASPDSSDGQTQIYLLLVPGTDFAGYVTFAPQEAYVRLFFPDSAGILEGDGLEALLAELRAVVPWHQKIVRASPSLLHPAAFIVTVDNVQVHAEFALQGHGPAMTLQATAVYIHNQLWCAPPCRGQTQT